MSSPEVASRQPERANDSEELASIHHDRREALRDSLEKAELLHEKSAKESAQSARSEALYHASSTAESQVHGTEKSPAEKRSTLITKRHREQSFNKQMDAIAPHLSRNERIVSSVIHHKTVEQISDAAGSTVARPNALLAGSITAFVAITAVYLIAKHYGYPLSGFETIGAFVIGWIVGLIFDYIRTLLSGGQSRH